MIQGLNVLFENSMIGKQSTIVLSTILVAIGTLSIFSILPVGGTSQPSDYATVLLNARPLSSYRGNIQGYTATMPRPGSKLDMSSPAVISYANRPTRSLTTDDLNCRPTRRFAP